MEYRNIPSINLICGKKLVDSVGIITDVKIRIIVIMVMVKVALVYYCRAELLMDAFACVVKLPHRVEIRDRACRRHSLLAFEMENRRVQCCALAAGYTDDDDVISIKK